jgi:hypothetical protein
MTYFSFANLFRLKELIVRDFIKPVGVRDIHNSSCLTEGYMKCLNLKDYVLKIRAYVSKHIQ